MDTNFKWRNEMLTEDGFLEMKGAIGNEPQRFNERKNAPDKLILDEIFAIEPRLKEIENDILSVDGSIKDFCANREWYSRPDEPTGFKKQMSMFVGWMSENPLLGSSATYNTVYQHLYGLLSECKHSGQSC